LDYSGFSRMINLVGGVWVTINQPMNYDDNAGNLHIHWMPGRYLMSGEMALRYVRFRGLTGDRGRMLRQHEFIRNFAKQLANPLTIFHFPEMVMTVRRSLNTNLSFWDVAYLTSALRRVRPENMGFYVLPGQPSGVLWIPKRDLVDQLMSMLMRGETIVDDAAASTIPKSNVGTITINVWNASSKKGLAYDVTKVLRQAGYDVLDWGNFPANQIQTRVVDRRGKITNARSVAETLGVESYHSEPNPKVLVDVEVVIGENYSNLAPSQIEE
jgi:polyisoprenyl-teichoic acid--peptidoglycan teichoic acid transferase